MEIAALKETDRRLSDIGSRINVCLDPTNEQGERERFFSNGNYNPVFDYGSQETKDATLAELNRIETDDSLLGRLLEEKKQEYISYLTLSRSIGTEDFASNSVDCFGTPGKSLIMFADEFIKKRQVGLDQQELDREHIIPSLNFSLKHFGLDWQIEEKEMVIKASVQHSCKKLFLNKNLKITREVVTRLIAHEIGTHILRAENGRLQDFRLFFDGFPNYTMTEEGLAVINEQLCGLSKTNLLKMYAGRVLAVDLALRRSFLDTFNELKQIFAPADAWTLTLRAKRGLRDTSRYGAYTKDYLYLKGYLMVIEYLEEGGDLYNLYYGKIGVEHANLIRQIPGLREPSFLPPNIERPKALAQRKERPLTSFF
jgi:uncharacterized protein (TIGR02421 family)